MSDNHDHDQQWRTPPPMPPGGLVKPGEPLMDRDWFFYLVLIAGCAAFFGIGQWLFGVL